MPFRPRPQMSPMIARALSQWGGYRNSVQQNGIIQNRMAEDVLPPESMIHLENLREQPKPESPQAINDHARYGFFNNTAVSVGTASQLVLRQPTTRRIFLFIVNTHALQTLYVTFGRDANATLGIPIAPNNGSIGFDQVVPQDDIFLIGSGAATTGVLVYSNSEV